MKNLNRQEIQRRHLEKANLMKHSLRLRLTMSLQTQSDKQKKDSSVSMTQAMSDNILGIHNSCSVSDNPKQRGAGTKQEITFLNSDSHSNNLRATSELNLNNFKNQPENTIPRSHNTLGGIDSAQFDKNQDTVIQTIKSNTTENQARLERLKSQFFQENPKNTNSKNLDQQKKTKLEKLKDGFNTVKQNKEIPERLNFQKHSTGAITGNNFFQDPNFNFDSNFSYVLTADPSYLKASQRPHQLDKFQKLNSLKRNQSNYRNRRLPAKHYQIKKPSQAFNLNLYSGYKLLLTNIASYALILIVLVGGFYLTFSRSGSQTASQAENQILGISEESQTKETKLKQEETQEENLVVPSKQVLEIEPISQDYNLSSQAASLQMALKYFEIETTQAEILERIGYSSPLYPQKLGGEIVWGDPSQGFLGDANGFFGSNGNQRVEYSTGWGVNSIPVARVAQEFLADSENLISGSISEIKKNLANKNPVLIWHQLPNHSTETLTIQTNQGKKFELKTHTVSLIIGYEETESGTVYFLNNPKQGQVQFSQNDLINQWSKMSRQAVVVR